MSKMFGSVMAGVVAIGAGITAMSMNPQSASASEATAANAFAVDSVHSMVVFRIKHMGVSYVYGRFNNPTGTFNVNPDDPASSFIDISVKTSDVDTGNEKRDNHLRSPDFFNAKQFQTIAFKSDSIESSGDGMVAKGKLTLSGVTKDISVNLEPVGEGETMQGYKQGFEGVLVINRSDYGITKYIEGDGLGDEVTLYVTFEGLRK